MFRKALLNHHFQLQVSNAREHLDMLTEILNPLFLNTSTEANGFQRAAMTSNNVI